MLFKYENPRKDIYIITFFLIIEQTKIQLSQSKNKKVNKNNKID